MLMDDAPDRILMLDGSQNLRDMGGYHTADGRKLKWRTLFRSGVMTRLTPRAAERVRELGIVAIVDLRANAERNRHPTTWHEGTDVQYHARDYEISMGEFAKMVATGTLDRRGMDQVIETAYRELPYEQAGAFKKLFRLLATGLTPLLFNCTAGKDRTGIAAALILYALGVSRETIEQDYALTNHAMDKLLSILIADPHFAGLNAIPQENYLPLLRADPAYLAVAFSEIERTSGGMRPYLDQVLGVSETDIAALKDVLLE
jgi:protein-tyrosine phosphatase